MEMLLSMQSIKLRTSSKILFKSFVTKRCASIGFASRQRPGGAFLFRGLSESSPNERRESGECDLILFQKTLKLAVKSEK